MFENRLELLREEKKLNRKEAAALLELPYTTYLSYEKNEREPNSEILIRLAGFFDADVDYLLGLSPYKKKENARLIEELGLSEKSIAVLQKLKEEDARQPLNDFLALFNAMLESPDFPDFLAAAGLYKSMFSTPAAGKKTYETLEKVLSEKGQALFLPGVKTYEDFQEYYHSLAVRQFRRLLESMEYQNLSLRLQRLKELEEQLEQCIKEIKNLTPSSPLSGKKEQEDAVRRLIDQYNSLRLESDTLLEKVSAKIGSFPSNS